jgi:hypothetical protein
MFTSFALNELAARPVRGLFSPAAVMVTRLRGSWFTSWVLRECFYAAQILFLGAELTRVAAVGNGGRDFKPLAEQGK